MTDLTDFGGGTETKPPLVNRKYIEQSPHTGKIAGFLGHEQHRNVRCYTTLRHRGHFYQKGGGWAISDSILSHIDQTTATLIFVHDGTEPDDDVYEFRASDYLMKGEAVPEEDLDDPDDPQTYIAEDMAQAVWENHAAHLFVREFREACDHIDWRGYDPSLKDDD